jgi:hypothetical protein
MAKRFIDTNMFSDEWVHSLSKDGKLFFVYYITNCDHAGILKLNRSLCEFQTGLKNFDTLIKDFGNTLITVKENVFFMPRFIKFQYPKFPQSNVKQQDSAIKILKSYNLFNEESNSYVTLSKELVNSYVSDSVNDIVITPSIINIDFEIFWNLYNKKKGDKDKIKNKWEKLNDIDRQKIIDTLPAFLNSITDKQYQPFPETYINNKRWNDVIENKLEKKQYTLSSPLGNWTGILTEDELTQKIASGYFKLEN